MRVQMTKQKECPIYGGNQGKINQAFGCENMTSYIVTLGWVHIDLTC